MPSPTDDPFGVYSALTDGTQARLIVATDDGSGNRTYVAFRDDGAVWDVTWDNVGNLARVDDGVTGTWDGETISWSDGSSWSGFEQHSPPDGVGNPWVDASIGGRYADYGDPTRVQDDYLRIWKHTDGTATLRTGQLDGASVATLTYVGLQGPDGLQEGGELWSGFGDAVEVSLDGSAIRVFGGSLWYRVAAGQGMTDPIPEVPTISASGTVQRGQASQTLTISATGGIDLDAAMTADFTLQGCVVTGYDPSGHVLTVTGSSTSGGRTLTHVPTGATTTVTVSDTVAPSSPTGLALGTPTATPTYAVPFSWTAVPPTPAGETIVYDVYRGASQVFSGLSSTSATVTGVTDGQQLKVRARDDANNASSQAAATFTAPVPESPGGGDSESAPAATPPATPVIAGVAAYPAATRFRGRFRFRLTGVEGGATAYVAFDGATPYPSLSTRYDGPIDVFRSTTVRVAAFRDGLASGVATAVLSRVDE